MIVARCLFYEQLPLGKLTVILKESLLNVFYCKQGYCFLKCTEVHSQEFYWRHINSRQATGLDAWASRVKCPARFVSHLHEICIYIWVVYSLCFFCCLFITVTCVVFWVGKWQSRGSTGMFGNLMAIYHIMLQFIQNHSRFVMLMIWK